MPSQDVYALTGYDFNYRWNRAEELGTAVTVTYSFPSSQPAYDTASRPGYQGLSAAHQAHIRSALDTWGQASGLNFVEVPASVGGEITFAMFDMTGIDNAVGNQVSGYAYFPSYFGTSTNGGGFSYYNTYGNVGGDVFLNSNFYAADASTLAPGVRGYSIVLHEIGHAIGFKHPFEDTPTIDPARDNGDYTVLSYNRSRSATELGTVDVEALHVVYGYEGAVSAWWDSAQQMLVQYGSNNGAAMAGSQHRDYIDGQGGNDRLHGQDGNDWLVGGSGNDVLEGDEGDDLLNGGAGIDWLFGDNGNDTLGGDDGDDWLQGLQGEDWLYGGAGADLIEGGDGIDRIWGGADNDRIGGNDGADFLYGEDGIDWIWGENGADFILSGAGNDAVWAGEGNDVVGAGTGNDWVYGDGGNDWLYAEGGDDLVVGGGGNDYLFGGSGSNQMAGDGGNDILYSGTGSDWMWGGADIDWFHFGGYAGYDWIMDFQDGWDRIDLSGEGWGYTTASQIWMTDDAQGNAFISLGYNSWISINGVSTSQISDADFIFG